MGDYDLLSEFRITNKDKKVRKSSIDLIADRIKAFADGQPTGQCEGGLGIYNSNIYPVANIVIVLEKEVDPLLILFLVSVKGHWFRSNTIEGPDCGTGPAGTCKGAGRGGRQTGKIRATQRKYRWFTCYPMTSPKIS